MKGELPPGTTHHNIHFGEQWSEAFQALLEDGARMPDPSILVTAPTVTDPSLAPDGRHILYVLEPVPNLDGRVDWHGERDRIRAELEARVGGARLPDRRGGGAPHRPAGLAPAGHGAGHAVRAGPPLLPDRARSVPTWRTAATPGLVFVGSGTIPGVGIPMVLVSGKLAANRIERMGRR